MFIAPDVILSESQRRVAPESRMTLVAGGCCGEGSYSAPPPANVRNQ